jgi:hypothetical protein
VAEIQSQDERTQERRSERDLVVQCSRWTSAGRRVVSLIIARDPASTWTPRMQQVEASFRLAGDP